jgi:hypothetical protein
MRVGETYVCVCVCVAGLDRLVQKVQFDHLRVEQNLQPEQVGFRPIPQCLPTYSMLWNIAMRPHSGGRTTARTDRDLVAHQYPDFAFP